MDNISPLAFYASNVDVKISPSNNNYISENGILYNKNKTTLIACTKNITSVIIPESVTKIEDYSFSGRTSLTNIALSKNLKTIGQRAFTACKNLTEIEIPNSVTEIGENCFLSTTNLKTIKIDKSKGSISGAPWGNMYADRAIIWNE